MQTRKNRVLAHRRLHHKTTPCRETGKVDIRSRRENNGVPAPAAITLDNNLTNVCAQPPHRLREIKGNVLRIMHDPAGNKQ